jgi:K+-transporting ATPase ATPase B chain
VPGVDRARAGRRRQLASLADETPEGRSIVVLARSASAARARRRSGARFVPFTARPDERVDDLGGASIRKGAPDAIRARPAGGGVLAATGAGGGRRVARRGGTPLVVAKDARVLGVVELKDIVKAASRSASPSCAHGHRTVMITGDNPLTAAAIAAEAGVDDFLAEATPEAKLKLIRASRPPAGWWR